MEHEQKLANPKSEKEWSDVSHVQLRFSSSIRAEIQKSFCSCQREAPTSRKRLQNLCLLCTNRIYSSSGVTSAPVKCLQGVWWDADKQGSRIQGMRWPFPQHSTGGWQLEQRTHFIDHYWGAGALGSFWRALGIPRNYKTLVNPLPAPAWCLPDPRGSGAPRWRAVPPWHRQCVCVSKAPAVLSHNPAAFCIFSCGT